MSNENKDLAREEIKKSVMERLEEKLGENKLSENESETLDGGFANTKREDDAPEITNNSCPSNSICL